MLCTRFRKQILLNIMVVLNTVSDLQDAINSLKAEGKSIGLVPTMGALHEGHISLVKESIDQNDITVVSVFVNPTQFNNQEDLIKYPRTLEADVKLLGNAGVDIVFAPSVEEVYPEPDTRIFDFGLLDKVMEGKHRPGHFNGVGQVVSRLFDLVKPNNAYFGEKDFQQLAIIRELVNQNGYPITIVGMPIIREESGLAKSSRNQRLSESQKQDAVAISKTLFKSVDNVNLKSVSSTIKDVVDTINKVPSLEVEYFEIVDGLTLQKITSWEDTNYAVGCITVFCGDVRLIDNVTYFNNLV